MINILNFAAKIRINFEPTKYFLNKQYNFNIN